MSPADLAAMVAYRDQGRAEIEATGEAAGGGCSWVSEWVDARYGYLQAGGCYRMADGRHAAHLWNLLPDGRILDVTADQFGEPAPAMLSAEDDRYLAECDGESCNDGEGGD